MSVRSVVCAVVIGYNSSAEQLDFLSRAHVKVGNAGNYYQMLCYDKSFIYIYI